MADLQMGPIETRFSGIIWQNEPLSSAELAKLLRLPQNTVLSRMARARKQLAKMLEGEFDYVEG